MEKAIYDILSNDSDVLAIVGNRIFPIMIPQGVKKECITYQRVDSIPSNDKSGTSRLDVIKMDVDFWGSTFSTLKDLKEKARTALDGFNGVNSGFTLSIIFESERDLFDDDVDRFHINQTYSIRLKR
ncbi:MAG: DUF3168 domain-containing protein [Candidatus Anammoxibacter sp.]